MIEFIPIVSFPKSGNTYCRAIVARLFFSKPYHVLPDAHRENIADSPVFSSGKRRVKFFKTHSRFPERLLDGHKGRLGTAVWIVRHPLDVFLSQRNYLQLARKEVKDARLWSPPPFASAFVRNRAKLTKSEDLETQFAVFMMYGTLDPYFPAAGNWFDHAENWREYARTHRCLSLKYEDLVRDPVAAMTPLAKQFGFSAARLERAVERARKDTKPDGAFFWKQSPGHYRKLIPKALIDKWYRVYGAEMRTFGYPR